MTNEAKSSARATATAALKSAGIVITAKESQEMEIADFGLGDFAREGLAIIVYANTDRYCGKELIMLPNQICPEHRHPKIPLENGRSDPGKMETFRCRAGEVLLCVEGEPVGESGGRLPAESKSHYTVGKRIMLRPGDQYTIPPNTRHWFQAGSQGAIVTEFSSTSRDEFDIFTDPRIQRVESSAENLLHR